MRRYLFVFTMTVLAIVIFLENIGIRFGKNNVVPISNEQNYIGKVTQISRAQYGYKLRVHLGSINEDILLSYYEDLSDIYDLLRTEISFEAELKIPVSARNPHCFDYRKYLLSEGIHYIASTKNITIVGREYSLYDRYLRYLEKKKNLFCDGLEERLRGTIMGVVFGETSYMSEETYDVFKRNGTAHILAVSGLHIGIFYSIFKKINGRRRNLFGIAIFIFVLFSYGTLAAWRPSVIRATAMIVLSLLARSFSFRYDRLTALSLIALILIISNPDIIYSTAFQMSFLAVIAIDIFTKVLPSGIPEAMKTTLAVNSALILYQAYVFNYVSIVSFILNIPVIFISGIFVPLSVFCFISHCFIGVTAPFIPVLTLISDILIKINEISNFGGKGSFDSVSPPLFFVVAVSLTAFALCSETFVIYRLRREKDKLITLAIIILLVASAAGLFSYNSISNDEIVFIDVGQGNATHIRDGSVNILIDGGGHFRKNIGKNTLKPYFLKNGESKVDLALATHKDMDHYKGLTELRDCFCVKKMYDESIMGDEFIISNNLKILTLWPKKKDDSSCDENSNGSVFLIVHKGIRILITGDIGTEGETEMISHYKMEGKIDLIRADVLSVGHHGSNTSTSEELLDVVKPSICIIQVGKNNYGHPKQEVLARIKERNIPIFRNDECGAIGIRIEKGKIKSVHSMLNKVG